MFLKNLKSGCFFWKIYFIDSQINKVHSPTIFYLCVFHRWRDQCIYNTLQYILNWPLHVWGYRVMGFSGPMKHSQRTQQQLLRISTGRRQTSRLLTSAAGKLSHWLPGVNSRSRQEESWTRELQISRQASQPLGRSASCLSCLQLTYIDWGVFTDLLVCWSHSRVEMKPSKVFSIHPF